MKPRIKIKDSMYVFMSYIFGMNMAIRKYIEPTPSQCPLVIDFWIIPNRTVMVSGVDVEQGMDNDIGNIKKRLDQNKVTYTKKKCTADDIAMFTKQITNYFRNYLINQCDLNKYKNLNEI